MWSASTRHRLVAVGADAEPVDVFAEVEVGGLVPQDRQAGFELLGVAPASAASGVVFAYWCAIGTSGMRRSTSAPIVGPHMPAQDTHDVGREVVGLGA